MTTYSTHAIPRSPKTPCHDCGANADIELVSDVVDRDGYQDRIALCRQCAKKRGY